LNPISKENRKTIRVVLAEDQGMVLGALAALLEIEGDISVIAKARNGKEALELAAREKPGMPGPRQVAAQIARWKSVL